VRALAAAGLPTEPSGWPWARLRRWNVSRCRRRGKCFHRLVQEFYARNEDFRPEQRVQRATLVTRPADFDPRSPWRYLQEARAKGRMDGFLVISGSEYAVQETKCTDWDAIAARGTLNRNLARHAVQLWRYLEGVAVWKVARSDEVEWIDLSTAKSRYGAVVYPRTPMLGSVTTAVQDHLGEYGLSTIWFDVPPQTDSPARLAWEAVGVDERLRSLLW
jgi:hypothetical protein